MFGGKGGPPLNVINIRNAKEQRNKLTEGGGGEIVQTRKKNGVVSHL